MYPIVSIMVRTVYLPPARSKIKTKIRREKRFYFPYGCLIIVNTQDTLSFVTLANEHVCVPCLLPLTA
jgi:hypothetical protein